MSYKNRTADNNQFKIAHAWPGICSLCFEEVAEYNGSNMLGKPIVKKLKNNYAQYSVVLNDNSKMTVTLCKNCRDNIKEKDMQELMESEINGWDKEVKFCVSSGRWTQERADKHIKKYSKKFILGENGKGIGLKERLEVKRPRIEKLNNKKASREAREEGYTFSDFNKSIGIDADGHVYGGGLITKPNTFSAGDAIVASEHNDNFDTVYNLVNGNISNANISASAGIVDTKLAQITTASKVALSAIPSIDEDDMSSDSASYVPTQQSTKAYVDTEVAAAAMSSIKDYGTSASSSTAKDEADLIICYGGYVVVSANSSQAITNLPFNATTSYQAVAVIGEADNDDRYGVKITKNSASQFTMYNTNGLDMSVMWIAIGT